MFPLMVSTLQNGRAVVAASHWYRESSAAAVVFENIGPVDRMSFLEMSTDRLGTWAIASCWGRLSVPCGAATVQGQLRYFEWVAYTWSRDLFRLATKDGASLFCE
ncbi:hypothetical protein GW17_00021874 [Ensete ventricosum]|nr:hypothetical protein GW17_00021874 [Ensete ventricosum]